MNKPANPYSARPTSKPLPIGIDFGTTNSAMSKYSQSLLNNGPVSFNFPITGGVLYPSMALLDCETGTIRTGNAAYTHRLTDPEHVISSIKRKISEDVSYNHADKAFTSTDIVEAIISDFVKEVKLTDHDIKPGAITLTVPYYFGENENAKILQAAHNALKSQLNYNAEVYLLPEPVAASIACIYNLYDEVTSKLFFIYDIGGGTLDLTLVRITSNSQTFEYEVLANDGISKFGGDDIDELIYNYIVMHEGLDFSQLESHKQILNRARLLDECKEAKHHLTSSESYSFMCSNLMGIENGYVELELTRDTLIDLLSGLQGSNRNMLSELNECINRLYCKAKITPDMVKYVVPVGGTSFIPLFRDQMTTIHPQAKELCSSNIMDNFVLVANGASIYSAMKCDELQNTNLHPFKHANSIEVMKKRVSHALYLEKFNGKYDIIVEANTLSPAKMQKRYYPTKFTSDGSLVDLGAVNLFQGKGESRKSKQFIGSIDFSEICIYAHGRNLDDIPVDITIEATDTLVIAHCLIPRSDIYGKDIKFKQVIHN